MGRLFVQKYFRLHSNFSDIVNYTLSSRFSGSGLIPIGGIPHFFYLTFQDGCYVKHDISQYWRDKRKSWAGFSN